MTSREAAGELGLRDYLGVLRRRKFVVVVAVVLMVALALALALIQTPVYAGKAEVLLQPQAAESLFDPYTGQRGDPVRAAQTEIRVLESQPVRTAVRNKIGAAADVSAAPAGQTDVIEVTATSEQPRRAAEVANAYATAYIDFRRQQAVDGVLAAAQQIQAKIDSFQQQIDGLEQQVAGASAAQQSTVQESVDAQKDSLIAQQGLFRQKLDELQVDAALKSGGAQLVTEASVPRSPVSPRPVRDAMIALALGLFIGVGLAFLMDYLDDSIKTKDDLEHATGGLPVIGLIPAVERWKSVDKPRIVSLTEPRSAAAEAYRTVRTAIQFLALERPIRTLQITSPSAQEGKTTTLANLGVALAGGGYKVIVVCCDLRRPRIYDFFGLDNSTGFSSVLLGSVPLSAALQRVPDQPGLSVLASGPVPPNPSELLSSMRAVEVLTSVAAEADIVLVDSPPVLPVTDALVLSGRVDATLVVGVAGLTTGKEMSRTVELLRQVDAPLVGSVLNGVRGAASYGYAYRYDQYEVRPQREPASANNDAESPPEKATRGRAWRRSPTGQEPVKKK